MGAPPMVRRPGRMMRGGPPPKYPGGLGAPEGERWVAPDPVGSYFRMNEAMMQVAARYAKTAVAYPGQVRNFPFPAANGLSEQSDEFADTSNGSDKQTDAAGKIAATAASFDRGLWSAPFQTETALRRTQTKVELVRFDDDQAAVIDLAQRYKRGLTQEEGSILMDWADEYGLPARQDASHGGALGPHFHIGPINHIPLFPSN